MTQTLALRCSAKPDGRERETHTRGPCWAPCEQTWHILALYRRLCAQSPPPPPPLLIPNAPLPRPVLILMVLPPSLVPHFLRSTWGLIVLFLSRRKVPELASGEDHSGSTAITSFVTPTHIILGNTGDSRAVLCREGKVHFGTVDHKPTDVRQTSTSFMFDHHFSLCHHTRAW